MEAVKYLPLLEELVIHCIYLSAKAIETIGRSCPLLKSFNYNGHWSKYMVSNLEAQAIAKNMPALRHLQLFGNKMGNEGVHAILEGCPNLESLDLRKCFHVRLSGDLGKLCSERIRDLKLPNESTDDVYQFAVTGTSGYATSHSDDETSDDDYVKEKITRKQRNRKTKKQKQKKNNKRMFD
ncbi:PREDICTED: putative F-box/LRR-repeat protein 23 [Erythranthe guttata]|nr:PREDICTED: putative F-box/LRR-repeat protein 23 [Erythranthe guttata]|eukprot:XP_012830442.1 PREDICTED: putative F-box/LRR-repeat protein 23 [Erythranthe guttata]